MELGKSLETLSMAEVQNGIEAADNSVVQQDNEEAPSVHSDGGSDLKNSENTSAESVDSKTEAVPSKAKLSLQFSDFANDPIEGLKYRIRYGKSAIRGCTSSDGLVVGLPELDPDWTVRIEVWREHSKDYKEIGHIPLSPGEFEYSIVSPKLFFEIDTEPHQGTPSQAGISLPPKPAGAPEQRINGESLAKNSQEKMAAGASVSNATPKSAEPSAALQKKASPPPAVSPQAKPTVQSGRTQAGNPLVTVYDATVDWFNRKILPALNYWTWADFKAGQERAPTSGHADVKEKSVKGDDPEALRKLNALIAFEEKQILVDYGSSSSAQVVGKYARESEPAWPAKSNVTTSRCLKYVKVALHVAGYTPGISATEFAKDSGGDWLAAGFSDVTHSLPTVKIKYGNQVMEVPDLVWALPGDVIVYQKAGHPDAPGHIDIRTYHGYGSDFIWPGRGGFPDVKAYKVIGVYRKYSDTAAKTRLNAFLRIIREHEAKGFSDPYVALRWDGAEKVVIQSLERHPSNENENKPAGAYQIKWRTFQDSKRGGVVIQMGWLPTFYPADQDRVAVYLLQARPFGVGGPARKSALGYILQGDVERAVNEAKLWNEWACLPGGGKQSQLTMASLKELFAKYTNGN
jgi:muramidase (phage lysozyme)